MRRTQSLLTISLALSALLPMEVRAGEESGMEKEFARLAEKLADQVRQSGRKKVAVLDFTDLQGHSSELGRFVAEELSVNLVERRNGFSIMDRANLKTILAQHKLTVDGLVEPANLKTLGHFSDVDAIVLGNVTPLQEEVAVTTKIIATDTAEIVGASKGRFPKSKEIENLVGRGISPPQTDPPEKVMKKDFSAINSRQQLDNLEIELVSFRFLTDGHLLASLTVHNTNKVRSVLAGLNFLSGIAESATPTYLIDDKGNRWPLVQVRGLRTVRTGYGGDAFEVMRRSNGRERENGLKAMAEIEAGQVIQASVEFALPKNQKESFGEVFKMQSEIITAEIFEGGRPKLKLNNLLLDGIRTSRPAK